MSMKANGAGEISFLDADDEERLVLYTDTDGSAGLHVFDRDRKGSVNLFLKKDGQMEVSAMHDGKNAVAFSLVPDGMTGINILDKKSQMRIGLGVKGDGIPGIWLFDGSGKDRVKIISAPDVWVGLEVLDADGKKIFSTRKP